MYISLTVWGRVFDWYWWPLVRIRHLEIAIYLQPTFGVLAWKSVSSACSTKSEEFFVKTHHAFDFWTGKTPLKWMWESDVFLWKRFSLSLNDDSQANSDRLPKNGTYVCAFCNVIASFGGKLNEFSNVCSTIETASTDPNQLKWQLYNMTYC